MPRLINISEAVSLGLHTMVLLATDAARRFSNPQIAETLDVSGHHLAKVMQRLARAGLVDSVSGPRGGFLLAAPAQEIALLRIYEAIDGTLADKGCLLGEPICDRRNCVLGEVLHSLHEQMRDYLSNTTLAELAKGSPFDKMLRLTTSDS
jgi:Rrf2 family nitric oxide-sensitive transcriptional repressor